MIRALVLAAAVLAIAGCDRAEREPRVPQMPILALAHVDEAVNHAIVWRGELTQGGWIIGTVPPGTISLTLDGSDLAFDAQGRFLAGFDRDAGASAGLVAKLADGSTVTRQLAIAPRQWQIEHIDAARRGTGPSADFLKRREPELAAIGAARSKHTGAQGWMQNFVWPVRGRVSGRFGSQRVYRGEPGSYHSGMDITTGEGGTPFVAPADGVVVLAAQNFSLEGNLLILDHGQGLFSAFLHASRLVVSEGDAVRQGQHIGNIGASGRATGPHLHWGITWQGARLDPLLFVGPEK
ncbi:MAG: peptidase [Erythrobacter sp. RIFCSPHIGHO2_12_FULL_63_10]|nr:MAG: peptidase [Erythrobacter sp. RIFCSPHIGHO2_12_FULL_63_10]